MSIPKLLSISKLAVELEGYWTNPPDRTLVAEGSLRPREEAPDCNYSGEIPSPPFNDLEDLFSFMKKYYPNRVGSKCGLHCHISLKNIALYSQLMLPIFYKDYFLPLMNEWGRDISGKWGKNFPITNENFWDRLNGKNHFCAPTFIPEKQILIKEKIQTEEERKLRYTHINFCWARHGTVEFRLLPMFEDIRTSISAITALVWCVEDYLEKNPPSKETKRREEINVDFFTPIDESVSLEDKSKELSNNNSIKLKRFNFFDDGKKKNISDATLKRILSKEKRISKPQFKGFNNLEAEHNAPIYDIDMVVSADTNSLKPVFKEWVKFADDGNF